MILRKINKNCNYLDKKGYVSIETVFALSFYFIIIFLSISYFTFIYPQITLEKEVSVLGKIAQRQGGLTASDIESFIETVSSYSYIKNSDREIEITATSEQSDIDVMNVTPLGEKGSNYIKSYDKDIIRIKIKIPSNNAYIKSIVNFFGVNNVPEYYVFYEPVMSERE